MYSRFPFILRQRTLAAEAKRKQEEERKKFHFQQMLEERRMQEELARQRLEQEVCWDTKLQTHHLGIRLHPKQRVFGRFLYWIQVRNFILPLIHLVEAHSVVVSSKLRWRRLILLMTQVEYMHGRSDSARGFCRPFELRQSLDYILCNEIAVLISWPPQWLCIPVQLMRPGIGRNVLCSGWLCITSRSIF